MSDNNMLKKFISFSYGSGVGLLIGFLTTIITTRILTPEDFGKASMFTLALNVCMIFIIFGTDQSFVRFFYEEQESKRGALLYNCLKTPAIIAVVTMGVFLLFPKRISIFLFGEYKLEVIILLAVGIVIQVVYRYSVLVIRMQKKGHLFSMLEVLNRSLQLILTILLFLLIKPSYEIIVFSTVITFFILTIVAIIVEKRFWSYKNYYIGNPRHSKLDILKYSYPLVLTTLITWLFQSFDRIALRHWSNFHELGLFAAAFKIVALLNVMQVAFTNFWAPISYEAFEKNPDDTSLYERTSKVVAFCMFILATLVIMFKDIIMIALGSQYAHASNIMPFMVFMPIMYTLSETTVIGINFFKRPKWHILIAVVSCIVNITANWILVPRYGALGAAISTASSYIVFFSLRTIISLKYYKVNYNLTKVYIILFLIALYGFYSISVNDIVKNILVGAVLLLIIVIMYYKDLLIAYKNFRLKRKQ